MKSLTLRSGPVLEYSNTEIKVGQTNENVTMRCVEFLFDLVTIDEGVTLGDIYALFVACPDLLVVYRRFYAKEICAHVAQGPLSRSEKWVTKYLELRRVWDCNSHTEEYTEMRQLNLMMVDYPESYAPVKPDADGFIRSCPMGIDARFLLDLPIRFSDEIVVEEADYNSKKFRAHLRTVHCTELCLGEVIQSVLRTLGYFENSEDTQETVEIVKEIDNNDDAFEYSTFEEIMEEDYGDGIQAACGAVFNYIGHHSVMAIYLAVQDVPDKKRVSEFFKEKFGDGIRIKKKFSHLNGRDFREIFSGFMFK